MKKRWIISLIFTAIIWGGGAYAALLIYDTVPTQLHVASTLLANEEVEGIANQESRELKEIIHESQKRVVQVEQANGSLGSGFLYNEQGDVVTNAHVVAGATDVKVKTVNSQEFSGKVIGISETTDVALIRVEGLKGEKPLEIAKDKKAEIGDEILALGSPLGLQNTVTTGIISGTDRDFDLEPYHYEDVYQISAPITHGNSGGPLISMETGEVLGINSAGMEQGMIGFSIPLASVFALIEGWVESPMEEIPYAEGNSEGYGFDNGVVNADIAEYLVSYFYESLNVEDYVSAYSLLGSSWHVNTTYESFREGYLHTRAVVIDDIMSTTKGETVTVVAILTANERKNGESIVSKYKVTYTVGFENDQLKILSGNGIAIE